MNFKDRPASPFCSNYRLSIRPLRTASHALRGRNHDFVIRVETHQRQSIYVSLDPSLAKVRVQTRPGGCICPGGVALISREAERLVLTVLVLSIIRPYCDSCGLNRTVSSLHRRRLQSSIRVGGM